MKIFISRSQSEDPRYLTLVLSMLRTLPNKPKVYFMGDKRYDWEIALGASMDGFVETPTTPEELLKCLK